MILTPQETIDFSDIRDTYAPTEMKMVGDVEFSIFSNVLGLDFYNTLKIKLLDKSNVLDFDFSTTYNFGNLVLWKGKYYKALENNLSGIEPNCNSWGDAPKFDNSACGTEFEAFWKNYLGRYLALNVMLRLAPREDLQLGLGKVAFSTQQDRIKDLINLSFERLKNYVEQSQLDCYSSCLLKNNNNTTCKKTSRYNTFF